MSNCNRTAKPQRFRRRPKKIELLAFRNLPENAKDLLWFVLFVDPIPYIADCLYLFSKVKLWIPVSPFCQHSHADIGFLTPGKVYIGVNSLAELQSLDASLRQFRYGPGLPGGEYTDLTGLFLLTNPDGSFYQLPYEDLLNFQRSAMPPATELSLPLDVQPGCTVDFHIGPFKGSACRPIEIHPEFSLLQTAPLGQELMIKLYTNRAGLVAKVRHD